MSTLENETEVSITHEGAVLAGTLKLPEGVSSETPVKQVVLMITGSGVIDRNENSMLMQLNTLNSLADTFAEAGIASLRFDKRGCAGSEGMYYETGFFDYVDDADAWLKALDTYPELNGAQRFVLGHSEGALISAYLCQSNPTVQGQVLLTPFIENVGDAIERQLQRTLDEVSLIKGLKGFIVRLFLRLSGNQLNRQRKLMKQIKRTKKSSIKVRKTMINAKWLREVTSVDPAEIYRQVSVPTLSIGGEKDIQCLPADAEAIADLVNAPVKVHVLSDMTHILRTDDQEPSAFRYKELAEKPIDARLAEQTIAWLEPHLQAKGPNT